MLHISNPTRIFKHQSNFLNKNFSSKFNLTVYRYQFRSGRVNPSVSAQEILVVQWPTFSPAIRKWRQNGRTSPSRHWSIKRLRPDFESALSSVISSVLSDEVVAPPPAGIESIRSSTCSHAFCRGGRFL